MISSYFISSTSSSFASTSHSDAAVEYVSKARFLLAQTFESIKAQYEKETKLPFILDYLEDSFKTKATDAEVTDVQA